MKIYFRKTFKYDPYHSGLDKYESYEAVTRQLYSPDIVNFDSKEHFDLHTYCSSLKRCVETARIISSKKVIKLDELREIKFSLHNLVNKEEFEKYGSSLVRKRFLQSFINDSLLERRGDIQERVEKSVKLLSMDRSDKLVVSHSFVMKIFEAILLRKLNIFQNPGLISQVIYPDKKTYGFGEGFEVIM